ncbi:ABC transporter substrate-binding protein [Pelagibius litoralis]|uniref:ABC transporter substrate-binding protein n=1 Tax=Pelagibius litoralis TaxID=374515 RepID=A0A967K9Q2_9PROT|nr:ABC transporter substrate-binding protein [Pelagibius litoralis]NIA70032.1 ABC transporter substrate-binding protein [Pelagibius litoralis]
MRQPFPCAVLAMLLIFALLRPAAAIEIELARSYPALRDGDARAVLHVIGTTDADTMDGLIRAYRAVHPDLALVYHQAISGDVYQAVEEAATFDGETYDLAISSAMDLQIKLVNDGHARLHRSVATARLPRWASWRERIFGFTREPAVIAYDTRAFAATPPQSRFELLNLLRSEEARFSGRIATYDPNLSGLGYLFATQDSLQSETYWRLMEVFGNLSARLSCCSGEMLDLLENGEVAVAYNVLGSYAQARRDAGAPIGIVYPEDYTLLMVRTALIPRSSDNPGDAGSFVDFLVSPEGQRVIAGEVSLAPVLPEGDEGSLIPVRLGPGLLVFLDALKRRAFLSEWQSAVTERR